MESILNLALCCSRGVLWHEMMGAAVCLVSVPFLSVRCVSPLSNNFHPPLKAHFTSSIVSPPLCPTRQNWGPPLFNLTLVAADRWSEFICDLLQYPSENAWEKLTILWHLMGLNFIKTKTTTTRQGLWAAVPVTMNYTVWDSKSICVQWKCIYFFWGIASTVKAQWKWSIATQHSASYSENHSHRRIKAVSDTVYWLKHNKIPINTVRNALQQLWSLLLVL